LEEIDKKQRLFKNGSIVIDLGAAPGSWSQYAAQKVLPNGRVIALDLLEMEPLEGVQFIQGDFTDDAALQQLKAALGETPANLVMSDMAPNITGMRSVDQPRSMYLAELALDMAVQTLKSGGVFVTKVFMGEGFDELVKACRGHFDSVRVQKPAASRAESRETYIAARGFIL
jgi:23S rRNA (uridine2552-2'-O)-methyltransferase